MSKIYKAAQSNDETYFRNVDDPKLYLSYEHNKSGDSVVHIAARYGHLNLIKLFLENGANPEICNFDGKRPLHDAAQNCHLSVVRYLLGCDVAVDCLKRADWTPLMLACTKSDSSVIEELLKHGADPALKNKDGWNSFHLSAREGHVEIGKILLNHDKSLWKTASKNGRTPLHTAALHGCTKFVSFLLESCDFPSDQTDSCGSTPLMDALRAGHLDTGQLLVSVHKADVSKRDNLGRQPIHIVAEAGQLDIMKYLLDTFSLVSVNAQSTNHSTPLHVAAKEGQYDMMVELLKRGADRSLRDTLNRTALHIASGAQHAECVDLLLLQGAEDNEDKNGRTASQMARRPEVVQVFEKYSIDVT